MRDFLGVSPSFKRSLKIVKSLNFHHGIAKSYKGLGDFYLKIGNTSEAFRNYSNSLTAFQDIVSKIKDPKMKEYYRLKFIDLPEILKKINKILEDRSFEISFEQIEKTPEKAIFICKKVHDYSLNDINLSS